MTAFLASFRNEWHKLMRRKKYIVFLCIGAGFCIAWAALGHLASTAIRQQSGGGILLALTPTPMGALPFFLQIMIPLLIFMGAADLITVEGTDGAMRAALCSPVERWKLYASKLAAIITYAAMYLACIFVTASLLNLLFGRPIRASAFFIDILAYALTLVPLAVLVCFAALAALLCRSGTMAMFLLMLAYLALNILPMFFPLLNELLFTSFLGWHRAWAGVLPRASRLIHMLAILLGYGMAFFAAGSLLFDRKEY